MMTRRLRQLLHQSLIWPLLPSPPGHVTRSRAAIAERESSSLIQTADSTALYWLAMRRRGVATSGARIQLPL
jgi:hypothetical protein